MSIAVVRPFFRTRMESLGFHEHDDAFNIDNIPSTLIDESFHIEGSGINIGSANQLTYNFEYGVTLRVYSKGFRDVSDALDNADVITQTILADILDVANRFGSVIKDVVPNSVKPVALGVTNDNIIVIEMDFTVKIFQCFNT